MLLEEMSSEDRGVQLMSFILKEAECLMFQRSGEGLLKMRP